MLPRQPSKQGHAHVGLLYRRKQTTEAWDNDFDLDDDPFRPAPMRPRPMKMTSAPATPLVRLRKGSIGLNSAPSLPQRSSSLKLQRSKRTISNSTTGTDGTDATDTTDDTLVIARASSEPYPDPDTSYEEQLADMFASHASLATVVATETTTTGNEKSLLIPQGILGSQRKLRDNLDSIRRLASVLDDLQAIFKRGRTRQTDDQSWNWCECIVRAQTEVKDDEELSQFERWQRSVRLKGAWKEMMEEATGSDSGPLLEYEKLEMDQVPGLVEVLEGLRMRMRVEE